MNRILTGIVLVDQNEEGAHFQEYPVVASKDTLMDYVIHNDIDEVFIAYTEGVSPGMLKEWVSEMEQMGIIVDVNIDAFDLLDHGNKTLNRVGKYAVVTFARNIISTRGMIMKRLLDIAGSIVGMVILGDCHDFCSSGNQTGISRAGLFRADKDWKEWTAFYIL